MERASKASEVAPNVDYMEKLKGRKAEVERPASRSSRAQPPASSHRPIALLTSRPTLGRRAAPESRRLRLPPIPAQTPSARKQAPASPRVSIPEAGRARELHQPVAAKPSRRSGKIATRTRRAESRPSDRLISLLDNLPLTSRFHQGPRTMATDRTRHDRSPRRRISRLPMAGVKAEIAKVIVGHDEIVHGVLTCLFVGGHALLEGVPGSR